MFEILKTIFKCMEIERNLSMFELKGTKVNYKALTLLEDD